MRWASPDSHGLCLGDSCLGYLQPFNWTILMIAVFGNRLKGSVSSVPVTRLVLVTYLERQLFRSFHDHLPARTLARAR